MLLRPEASPFFRFLVGRHERASLNVISNKRFVARVRSSTMIHATAILDGLLHHASTVNIKGDSFRLREKKKAGSRA